jgi:hypothetical protein
LLEAFEALFLLGLGLGELFLLSGELVELLL